MDTNHLMATLASTTRITDGQAASGTGPGFSDHRRSRPALEDAPVGRQAAVTGLAPRRGSDTEAVWASFVTFPGVHAVHVSLRGGSGPYAACKQTARSDRWDFRLGGRASIGSPLDSGPA
jgi:hypothetical protein